MLHILPITEKTPRAVKTSLQEAPLNMTTTIAVVWDGIKMETTLEQFLKPEDREVINTLAQKHDRVVKDIELRASRFSKNKFLYIRIDNCPFQLLDDLFTNHALGKYDLIVTINA
jgi:hypothetical protein